MNYYALLHQTSAMNSDTLAKELITLDVDLVGIGMVQSQCSLTWEEGGKSGTSNTCLTAYHMFSQSFHDTSSSHGVSSCLK